MDKTVPGQYYHATPHKDTTDALTHFIEPFSLNLKLSYVPMRISLLLLICPRLDKQLRWRVSSNPLMLLSLTGSDIYTKQNTFLRDLTLKSD